MPAPAPVHPSNNDPSGETGRFKAVIGSLLVLTLALLAWSAVTWLTGGFSYQGTSIRFSSRDPLRPLLAGALGAVLLVKFGGWSSLERTAGRIWTAVGKFAPIGALAAAALACVLGLEFGTHAASGSDPYGYISQADLWAQRQLSVDFTSLAPLPWRDAEWTLSPLGYRPATTPYHIVPTYAPGLPILMAVFKVLFGASAVYWVVPLCAGLAVWLTYVLGRQLVGPDAGLLGAALLTASPAFLYQTMWPMSDVPVTTFWLLALVSSNSSRRGAAAVSGIASAVAILIRPNLAPLVVVPLWWIAAATRGGGRRRTIAAVATYAATFVVGPLIVAVLNAYWYGSPMKSGYGNFDALYAAAHVLPNVRLYGGWLVETQSILVALAIVPFIGSRWRPETGAINDPHVRAGLLVFACLVVGSYLFYLVFEAWWYLRFLLPAYPLLAVLAASGLLALLRRVRLFELASVLVVVPWIAWMTLVASSRGVFALHAFEQRYVRVARDLAALLPPRAVVFAMQHSGSVRYYADRLTLRYDYLPPRRLDRAVNHLRRRGMPAYVLLEDWEEPAFVARFAPQNCRGTLQWGALRQWQDSTTIRLYDLSAPDCRRSAR